MLNLRNDRIVWLLLVHRLRIFVAIVGLPAEKKDIKNDKKNELDNVRVFPANYCALGINTSGKKELIYTFGKYAAP